MGTPAHIALAQQAAASVTQPKGKQGSLTKDAAQQMLDNRLKTIISRGDPSAAPKAIATATRKGEKESPVAKVLGFLGKPLSATASLAKETTDLVRGEGFSTHDLRKQFNDNYSFGKYLQDETPNMNPWLKRGLGFVGDVALDPLTYLAPEAKLEELGTKGAAEELAKQGLEDAGARVLKKGVSSLSDEELSKLGAKGGLYMNVPGTGRVGRFVGDKLGMDIEQQQVRLLGRNPLTTGVARTVQGAKDAVLGTETAAKFGRALGGDRRILKEAIRSGDADKAFTALHTLNSDNQRRLVERAFEAEHGQTLHDFLQDAKKAGVDGKDLWHAAAGDSASAARVDSLLPGGTERATTFFDTVQQAANKKAGVDWLMHREDYAPRFLHDDAREAEIVKGGKPGVGSGPFKGGGMERRAKYVAGEPFLGTVLQEPKVIGKSIEKQMDEIAVREYGDKAHTLFNTDAYETFPRYLRSLSKKTGARWMEQDLLAKGVAMPLWETFPTGASLQRVAAKRWIMKLAEQAGLEGRMADARLRQTTEDLAREQGAKKAAAGAAKTAATGALDTVDTKAADAVREYGDWFNDAADAVGSAHAGLPSDLTTHGAEQVDAAKVAAMDTRLKAQESAVRLNRLEAERHRLEVKLAASHASVADQVKAGARVSADRTALEELTQHADDETLRLMDSGRTLEQVQAERAGVHAKLQTLQTQRRELERNIANAEEHGLGDEAEAARQKLAALNKNIAMGESAARRGSAELSAMKRIHERFGPIDQWATEVDKGGMTAVGDALGEMNNRLGVYEGVQGPFAFHGTPRDFDITKDPLTRETMGLDAFGAPHFEVPTDGNPSLAESFASGARGGVVDSPGGQVGKFDLHMQNPKQYGQGLRDASYEPDVSRRYTGSDWGHGQRELQNDMFRAGWDSGVITPETLVPDLSEPGADELRQAWEEVAHITENEGVDLQDAVHYVFSDDPHYAPIAAPFEEMDGEHAIDRFSTPEMTHTLGPNQYVADPAERVYSAVVHDLAEHESYVGEIHPDTMAETGEAWRNTLAADGYDGAAYTMERFGTNSLMPLDPEQVQLKEAYKVAGGGDATANFKDYWQERDRLVRKINEPVAKYQDALGKVDRSLATVGVDAHEGALLARDNERALARVQREVSVERATLGKKAHELSVAEFGLRSKAAEQYALATELEQTAQQAKTAAASGLVDEAQVEFDRAHAEVVRLTAQSSQQQADLLRATGREDMYGTWLKKLGDPQVEYKTRNLLREGFKAFGPSTQTPEFVVDALTAATRLETPEGLSGFVKAWDGFTNLWKGYATLTPGFHSRNFMGGVFNNWLAGVELGRQREFTQSYVRFITKGSHGLTGAKAEAFDRLVEEGLLSGGQTVHEVERKLGQLGTDLRPWSSQNVLVQGSRTTGGHVENTLRGALAWDTLLKGGSVTDAIDAVNKYHFDYEDLSAFERSVVKRVIPFYTWTRKNLPLMLEEMVRQPGKFATIYKAKQELELGTTPEGIVPGYFGDNLGVHLPFKIPGQGKGEQYLLPDLPFRDLTKTVEPANVIGMLNPLIKTPLELQFGKQVYNGAPIQKTYQEAPAVLRAIPGMMPALRAFGRVKTNSSGKQMVRGTDLYVLEQALPIFGRARRLFPSEDKYSQRVATSWLGFLFGAGIRTNTDTEQRNELMRRLSSLDSQWSDQRSLGNAADAKPKGQQRSDAALAQIGL